MSKNRNVTMEVSKEPFVEEAMDAEIVDENLMEEVSEMKESLGKKIIRGLKKAAPVLLFGGAIATAFAIGRSSGTDSACLAMLEAENTENDETSVSEGDDSEETSEEGIN